MFFVKVKRREYQVRFRHENKHHRYTICEIKRGDWIVATGAAECHPKDNFCKGTGRKLSLSRALQTLLPNKKGKKRSEKTRSLRLLFWDAYALSVADLTDG